mmetsp:Transcript_12322/g.29767  ORF Transcript_12322/g.29767 Transcript_12322/m.29767 type:complete len:182 (-) Transcript_12322:8-553(-)
MSATKHPQTPPVSPARGGRHPSGPSSPNTAATAMTMTADLLVCCAMLVLVNVLSKIGDALAPTLVDARPLLLLALNANDLHLALTAGHTQVAPYCLISIARRLAEDPLYYYLGWTYGTRAVDWLSHCGAVPGLHNAIHHSEAWFRRMSTVAVAVAPGAAVCLLAGSSRMSPPWFTVRRGST